MSVLSVNQRSFYIDINKTFIIRQNMYGRKIPNNKVTFNVSSTPLGKKSAYKPKLLNYLKIWINRMCST